MMAKKSVQRIIIIAAIILITAGLLDGGYRDVLSKAVMICMECIGIG